MRILANENFPGPILRELRRRGHDVVSVKESMRGASDREVLERAQQEDRLVLTFDKDFGELAYQPKLLGSRARLFRGRAQCLVCGKDF